MEYRARGGTGVHVSHLYLGAMMFGACGNTDHAESVRINPAGQDVVLDDATLDRIDELVLPGTNVNPRHAGRTSPALAAAARRRS